MKTLHTLGTSIALTSLILGCGSGADSGSATTPPPVTAEPTTPATPAASGTKAVVDHHLAAFGKGDMKAILSDYTDNSVFMTTSGTMRGPAALRPVFAAMFAEFAKPGASFKMHKQVIEGDVAFIVWSAETADNVYELATDTFVVQNGKIAFQTFAGKIAPKTKMLPRAEAQSVPVPSPTLAVVLHHLKAFGAGNMDDILSDYTDTSMFITAMGTLKGPAALKPVFAGMFAEFAKPGATFAMKKIVIEGPVALIVWSAETADNVYDMGTDTFIIKDGKIAFQTFAVKVTRKTAPTSAK